MFQEREDLKYKIPPSVCYSLIIKIIKVYHHSRHVYYFLILHTHTHTYVHVYTRNLLWYSNPTENSSTVNSSLDLVSSNRTGLYLVLTKSVSCIVYISGPPSLSELYKFLNGLSVTRPSSSHYPLIPPIITIVIIEDNS